MNIEFLITDCAILPVPGREAPIESGFLAIGAGHIFATSPMAACP